MGVIGVGGPYELDIVPEETALDCGPGGRIDGGMKRQLTTRYSRSYVSGWKMDPPKPPPRCNLTLNRLYC